MNKRPSGKSLPVGGRDYNLLDALLTRTYVTKAVRMSGKIITARVLIRTARQNTQRFLAPDRRQGYSPFAARGLLNGCRKADRVKREQPSRTPSVWPALDDR